MLVVEQLCREGRPTEAVPQGVEGERQRGVERLRGVQGGLPQQRGVEPQQRGVQGGLPQQRGVEGLPQHHLRGVAYPL
jgi:hypothetical protein